MVNLNCILQTSRACILELATLHSLELIPETVPTLCLMRGTMLGQVLGLDTHPIQVTIVETELVHILETEESVAHEPILTLVTIFGVLWVTIVDHR